MAWGQIPILGNVKLIIVSERMVNEPPAHAGSSKAIKERLVVRWKTCGKTREKEGTGGASNRRIGGGGREQLDKITEWVKRLARDDEEFCGLFIFEFDEHGRILTHIIEHAEESGNWDKTSKVVTVTDWLLGKAKRKDEKEVPGLVLGGCYEFDQRRFAARPEMNLQTKR